ncbi:MAG: TetR/AcrR family transcriptional regulator [Gordonia sp. (in: high G+C Gram-positive bacteria)]
MAQQGTRLTVPVIVATAIDLADSDGLDAVSMRRIADTIGVGVMSLYRHVADKDALLRAMADEIGRRFPYPVDSAPPWRERVAIAVDIDWGLYLQHPWVVLAYAAPRYAWGADTLAGLNWLAEGFTELGVDAVTATRMGLMVWSYVDGIALEAVADEVLGAGSATDLAGGLADIVAGRVAADLSHLPVLAALAGRATGDAGASAATGDAGASAATGGAGASAALDPRSLMDPRSLLDAGVEYLCAGFAAAAAGR